jgi:hypothetical protein
MKTFIENFWGWIIYLLYGPNPKMGLEDFFRLIVELVLVWMLAVHLLAHQFHIIVNAWQACRTQKKLARLAERLGFQTRREVRFFQRTFVCEGTHLGRAVRFFTYNWRGALPMAMVAAACREPSGLWLQVRPKRGWMLNALLAYATYRPRDFCSNESRLRAFPLGDPLFDEAYAVKSNQPALAAELLTQKVQAALLAVHQPRGRAPTVTIAEGEARYAVLVGGFTDVNPLAEKMDFVCGLAEAAEQVHA